MADSPRLKKSKAKKNPKRGLAIGHLAKAAGAHDDRSFAPGNVKKKKTSVPSPRPASGGSGTTATRSGASLRPGPLPSSGGPVLPPSMGGHILPTRGTRPPRQSVTPVISGSGTRPRSGPPSSDQLRPGANPRPASGGSGSGATGGHILPTGRGNPRSNQVRKGRRGSGSGY